MARAAPPRVWALLGAHPGDNNQILALAESLGLPFETKLLRYNQWRHLHPRLLGATLRSLTRQSREMVAGEPPDLTISCGHRSVPVVQELRRRSQRRTRSVHIGYPRLSPDRFDLVVTAPEYPVPDHPHVLRIPLALSRARRSSRSDGHRTLLAAFPEPRRLLVIGGPTLFWKLVHDDVHAAVSVLLGQAKEHGGSLWVVGSPRTPAALLERLSEQLAAAEVPVLLAPTAGPPSYASLIASADAIFVTADSVAMVSDAILAKKPVGLVPIRSTALGRIYSGILDKMGGDRRMRPRDLRFFWAELAGQDLVGTIDQPRAARVPDFGAIVARRVLALIER
jgi:mitochondrial fission protein ELM1